AIDACTLASATTTGSTLRPVMNFMSSIAKTFVGSTMASVRVAPTRDNGRTEYFWATSGGMRRRTESSVSNKTRLTDGMPYWRDSMAVIVSSETSPRLTGVE